MNKLDNTNINQDEEFNNLQVNKIKTDKLEYSYKNDIIYITNINCKYLILNENNSDNLIITKDKNMDININLNTRIIGTKYKILFTEIQKSLKITCNINDKIIGSYKLHNNSNIVELSEKENKLRKQLNIKCIEEGNEIIYIPHYDLGLYNGGILELLYIGTNYNNTPEIKLNQLDTTKYKGQWLLNGSLVGYINIPRLLNSNNNIGLKIYIHKTDKKIYYVTSTIDNHIYFNKLYNNKHILLFMNMNYNKIEIIDITNNEVLYNNIENDNYNMKIKKKDNTFMNIENKLNLKTGEIDSNLSIETLYNIDAKTVNNIINYNIIEFKIIEKISGSDTILIDGYMNITDINGYYNKTSYSSNNTVNEINCENILFDTYNGFSIKDNKLNYII